MGVAGRTFTSQELVDRVLDFANEQVAAGDMLDGFLNLGVHQGSAEERAIQDVAAGVTERMRPGLEEDGCDEVLFLIQKARAGGAAAAGVAGEGAAWALLRCSSQKQALAFEAAWRHAHAGKYGVPCDVFVTLPTCGGMQYERGNHFD
jgi:hypothetical protein